MNKIIVKIKNWDEKSNSLIVSFASDLSEKKAEEYVGLAYQPTMFDNSEDVNYVLQKIAQSGASICEMQNKQESFAKNEQIKNLYANLIGKEFEYEMSELFPPFVQQISINEEPR